jgi:hypothetical protein
VWFVQFVFLNLSFISFKIGVSITRVFKSSYMLSQPLRGVSDSIRAFVQQAEPHDDLTLLAASRKA